VYVEEVPVSREKRAFTADQFKGLVSEVRPCYRLQGYLVHKKPPWDHHKALGIGLL